MYGPGPTHALALCCPRLAWHCLPSVDTPTLTSLSILKKVRPSEVRYQGGSHRSVWYEGPPHPGLLQEGPKYRPVAACSLGEYGSRIRPCLT